MIYNDIVNLNTIYDAKNITWNYDYDYSLCMIIIIIMIN